MSLGAKGSSMDEATLQGDVDLLEKEFPELSRATIERVLRECDGDLAEARRKLYALPSEPGEGAREGGQVAADARLAQQMQQHFDAGGSDRPASDPLSSWLSGSGSGSGGAAAAPGEEGSWNLVRAQAWEHGCRLSYLG